MICCPCTELDHIMHNDNISALAYDGAFVFQHSAGFTNSTGAMRIDWEHEARTTGDAKNSTNLTARGLFIPGAAIYGDLLPCCLSYPPFIFANLTSQSDQTGGDRTYSTPLHSSLLAGSSQAFLGQE